MNMKTTGPILKTFSQYFAYDLLNIINYDSFHYLIIIRLTKSKNNGFARLYGSTCDNTRGNNKYSQK